MIFKVENEKWLDKAAKRNKEEITKMLGQHLNQILVNVKRKNELEDVHRREYDEYYNMLVQGFMGFTFVPFKRGKYTYYNAIRTFEGKQVRIYAGDCPDTEARNKIINWCENNIV